ncbi:MAG TPA: hypothetical protein VII38_15745, partial [Polyangia bacterium]
RRTAEKRTRFIPARRARQLKCSLRPIQVGRWSTLGGEPAQRPFRYDILGTKMVNKFDIENVILVALETHLTS